jgi:chromosome segregation protein
MYLKRLELRGFKTFASYTDFLFDAGITAVVGPNGSGKSNIADAVRWVLGEQSYTALRGKRTEDMIFAGTSRRAQLGMAEAILTFDNASHWLPIDFGEVTVSRRAYRSGENQYLINGSRVRLRDVTELLGKAGLGRQGFVVIGQGLVDAALTLRAEERRILFEEAAGIHVYQEKRAEALDKLAETQQNLLRLHDILSEIAPRMRDLEHQAKRAQEREILSHDLEKMLRLYYGYHWQRLQVRVAEANASLHRRQEDLSLGRGRVHEVEAFIAGTQARQGELRRQLSVWHQASAELHSQAEATGRELAVSRERLGLLQARQMELQAEVLQLEARRSSLDENTATAQAALDQLLDNVGQQAAGLQDLRAQWQHTEGTRQGLERDVEKARDQTFRLATALADARNRWKASRERQAQVLAERDKGQRELVTVEDGLAALKDDTEKTQHQRAEAVRAMEKATARQSQAQERLATLEGELPGRREAWSAAARERQRAEDRHEMLQGLRESMAGLAPGVKAVLEGKPHLSGILGPVTGLLRVPERLERAIEAALGSYAQALVVESWDDAARAIAELRQKGSGWATFLPLDSLTPPPTHKAPAGQGILGLAQELVEYDTRYAPAFQLLLGRVVVVENLDTARRVRPGLQSGQRIVTLSGDVVQATGIISGGSGKRQGSLLAQEREWRELPGQLKTLQESEQEKKAALRKLEEEHTACRQDVAAATQELKALSAQLQGVEKSLSDVQQKMERLHSESEWRRRLDEGQLRELRALEAKAADLQHEVDQRMQEHSDSKTNLDELMRAFDAARHNEDMARQAATDADMALAVVQRRAEEHQRLLATQRADAEHYAKDMADRSQRAIQSQHEAENLAARVAQLQADANDVSVQLTALGAQMDPAEAELQALDSQAASLEKELVRARQRLSELDTLYSQQVLESERRRDAFESLERRIEEDLGDIEYPTERVKQLRLEFLAQDPNVLPPADTLPENLGTEIKDLKARLRRMGSVNPNAPQEYREVSQRHHFLQAQMSDLEQSAASLQQVIKELDEVMKNEFLSVFSIVASEFSRYFELLFRGGQARLTLTDPDNPSTTGVEILARPPGKRQQSLALLSGGERALTATALLLAVLKAKPLPFCFLDEVDAMLDEANVGRFRGMLEEFAKQTQFIVITHNRQTIEAANTIYGISMSEDGVSKVISLQMKDVEKESSRQQQPRQPRPERGADYRERGAQ